MFPANMHIKKIMCIWLNLKRNTSSLAPPIIYVSKKFAIKGFPLNTKFKEIF